MVPFSIIFVGEFCVTIYTLYSMGFAESPDNAGKYLYLRIDISYLSMKLRHYYSFSKSYSILGFSL